MTTDDFTFDFFIATPKHASAACVYGHPKLGWPYTRTRRCQKYGHPKYEKPFEFKFKNFGWGYRSLAADTGVVIQRAEQAGGDGGA